MTLHRAVENSLRLSDVAHFWKFGYVKLPNFLSEHNLSVLRTAMDSALGTLEQSPNGYNATTVGDSFWSTEECINDQGSEQHDLHALSAAIRESGCPRLIDVSPSPQHRGRFFIDTSVWRREPRLAQFARSGSLPEAAAILLAVNRLRFFDDQLFVKEAGALDRAAFHQDLSYFHLDGTCGCVIWIPLDPVRRGGGAMGYVSGSHMWGQTFNPNVFLCEMPSPGSVGVNLPPIETSPENYGVQYVEADPGDIIIHHFQTIHGSEGNRSNQTRRAFSLRYCDADIRYCFRPGAPAQPLHRSGVGEGESLDNEIHPIVWSATSTNTA